MNNGRKVMLLPAICFAAFSCAFAFANFFLAMPFVIRALGGQDLAVGMAMAFCYAGYILSCSLGSVVLDRFDEKKLVLSGLASNATLLLLIYLIFKRAVAGNWGSAGDILSPVVIITFLIACVGSVQTLIWPPLMGWVSKGHEGKSLTMRLGKYNLGWGSAAVIGPILAGWVVEQNVSLALVTTGLFFFISFLIILLFTKSRTNDQLKQEVAIDCSENNSKTLSSQAGLTDCDLSQTTNAKLRLLWAARQSFFIGAVAFILLKTQLPLRMVDNYGYSKVSFGNITMLVSLANLVAFIAAGKLHSWHEKYWPIVVALAMQAAGLLIILATGNFLLLSTAVILCGLGYGFSYSAHQYYGVAGSKKRSASMAIHEITLSVGFAAGSVMGGITGQHLGRDWPWIVGVGLLGLSVLSVFVSYAKNQMGLVKIKKAAEAE